MQDFALSTGVWTVPDFAQADRRAVDDMGPHDVDEASLAQFEALLPAGLPIEPVVGSGSDGESAGAAGLGGIGGIGGIGPPGVAAATVQTATISQNEARGRLRDARATQSDAIVSEYTIHHARLGVVHVQQSNGGSGSAGALTLSTDDEALRVRLRDAMPALRGALTDVDGRGPDISVDA
ncbi:MAG: hypothetical protein ACRYGA_01930 [Janthinobacterium lividum]